MAAREHQAPATRPSPPVPRNERRGEGLGTGETQAIWDAFSYRLRAFISHRVGNAADNDDILQDVFLRIHRHAGSVEFPDRLTSWLFEVNRNAIIDRYRSPRRRREVTLADPERFVTVSMTASATVDADAPFNDDPQSAAFHELATGMVPLIAYLPANDRQALQLVDLDGMTPKDAAVQLGLSVSGMKSRVQRGRGRLRQLLHDCCQIQHDTGGRIMDFTARDPPCAACVGAPSAWESVVPADAVTTCGSCS